MASPNTSEIITSAIEARSGKVADNVTKNTPLLARLNSKGNIRSFSGGRLIYEELSYAETGTAGWYSGYDILPVQASDVLTAPEYSIKQLAVPVTMSGLERLQNSGKEAMFDLMETRIKVAESTMENYLEVGLFSDGTGSGGKTIVGMDAAVPQDPTTGTYGGINRATASNVFWRSQLHDTTPDATTIQVAMNTLWAKCVRGADRPDLIILGATIWGYYLASLQGLQQFVQSKTGDLGFETTKYQGADVILGGGIGGAATATDAYFLNTKYIHFRPHKDMNMKPIGPKRYATNQDAVVEILGWAGALTCSGAKFQGRGKWD